MIFDWCSLPRQIAFYPPEVGVSLTAHLDFVFTNSMML